MNNAFTVIEKYRLGIEKYKKIGDNDRIFELLRNLSEFCIHSGHYVFAKAAIEELYNLSKRFNQLYFSAEANYLNGYALLKEGNKDFLEFALKKIQQASVEYEKIGDYAGAGKAYNHIGLIYQTRLIKPYNACLFYVQAIKSYNEAILKGYYLRRSSWAKADSLSLKILELKDIIEELIANIEILEERQKIVDDLKSIRFNF